jgi:hypothetical protein
MSKVNLSNQSAASIDIPASGTTQIFVDTDKKIKTKDDTGAVFDYSAVGSAITQLTGEVTAGPGPGSVGATVSNAAVLGKVLTGLVASSGVIAPTDTILQAFNKLVNKQNGDIYPNLGMGNTVIAANTSLTSDLYCDTLTVNLGATLFPNGYRVFAKTSIVCNGTIDRSGTDAAGTGATAALTAGTLAAAGAGGAGGTAAGSAGGASAVGLGGSGGAGGATGSAGGVAGAFTLNPINSGSVEVFYDQARARLGLSLTNALITGGSGGGGGAGDGTAGGGGGTGGALMVLVSRSITGTGSIVARGGNGFQPLAGNRGGGGGGGGGVIVTISENDVTTSGLTFNVAGGIGASGSGTGGSGLNGSNGRIYNIIA